MKNIFKVFTFLTLLLLVNNTFGQNEVKRSNNKVSLNGKPYYIHIVRKGETLFAISQAYNISADTIKLDNLHLSDDIKVNQFLKIRINEIEAVKPEFILHKVVKGDTPFNLALRYQISVNDIYKYNPNARMGIFIDEIIKIPVKKQEKIQDTIIQTKKVYHAIHIVEKKQTIFGIAALYMVSKENIEKSNPEIIDRSLQVGETLRIPLTEEAISKNELYNFHLVKAKETEYGLSKLYNIKEKELAKLNPGIKIYGLQLDEYIKIPKNDFTDKLIEKPIQKDTVFEKPEKDIYATWENQLIIPGCENKGIDTITSYKVAMFLPFYLNINDTLGKFVDIITVDTDGIETIETKPRTGKIEDEIYSRSQPFVEFYEGALLAINNLKKKGISFEIQVFDTQKDSVHTMELLKSNPDLKNYDLFIGPIYGDLLNVVGDFAWEHKINIVSPLSVKSGFIDHNPYAFQVSPPFEVQMHHASEFLNNFETKNYIVIHDGNNLNQEYISMFKKQLYAQINDQNFNDIKYNEVFYYDAQDSILKEVFTPGIENVVIVPSRNQAFVTDVMGKLNGYSFDYDISTFGQPRWFRFENIELENFHNTKTHIFSNSFIDYENPEVIEFVKDFKRHFNTEPEKFAFQGYDITQYFLLALNKYGKDFRKCIHMHDVDLIQTKLNFVPISDQSGYQNTAIYILKFSKDFKLKKIASYPR